MLFIGEIPSCFSQNKKPDSLWQIFKNSSEPDTTRLIAINSLGWSLRVNDSDSALKLAAIQLEFAEKTGHEIFAIKSYVTSGVAHTNTGNHQKAIEYFSKAYRYREQHGDKKGMANTSHFLSATYFAQANFTKALEFALIGLRLAKELGEKGKEADALLSVGNVYLYQNNYNKALEYYLKALAINLENNRKDALPGCYTNIGAIYNHNKNYEKASEFFLASIKISEELGDKREMSLGYINLGGVYHENLDFKTALSYYLKAADKYVELGDKHGLVMAYYPVIGLYFDLKDYKNAERYGILCIATCKEIDEIDYRRLVHERLSWIYSKTNRYKEAYENHVKFKHLTDSIFNEENSKELGDLKTQFEVEKKEAELKIKAEAQQAISAEEKKKHQIIIYAVAGILLLVVIFSLFLYNRFRITQKQKLIIEEQKILVDHAYESLHEKNKEVMDSIHYARRIQRALITSEKYIENRLNKLMRD